MDFGTLQILLKEKQYNLLKEKLEKSHLVDIADFINHLDAKDTLLVFRLLPKDMAAEVFSYLTPASQAQISVEIKEKELYTILEELRFDDKIDFLEEMPANVVKKILLNSSETERRLINQFLNYLEDSAGSIMTIEFVELKKEMKVQESLEIIRQTARNKETIYTCYVTDAGRRLEGIVSLRELVAASPGQSVADIIRREFISAKTLDNKEYVASLIKKYDLLAIPVTDQENRLVGIITVDDIVDVIDEEITEDIHKMATVGKIDINLLDASPLFMVKKRLPWLLVLIVVGFFAGSGIAVFEETIQAAIALVFFLPLLIDSAGNAGSQSAALMIRALAVGDVEIGDWFELFKKELAVSILLGLVMAAVAYPIGVSRGGPDVAVVVSLSMTAVVLVGSLIGMSLPFLLSRFKLDPALASAPLVTSITDVTGVLIYFFIASRYLGL